MREYANAEKAAPGSLKAALNPGAACNGKAVAEQLQRIVRHKPAGI